MKLRQRPEDFVVVERSSYELVPRGPFTLYRLIKWDIGTLEALRQLARAWRLPRPAIACCGLKDRHAHTEQVISVRRGPQRAYHGSSFRLEPLGQARAPMTRSDSSGNHFEITVRDLGAIPDDGPLRRWGVPNYFDDRRFGSLRGTDGEFIGRALVRGEDEQALRLALACPDRQDRSKPRRIKHILRERWGDWAALAKVLPAGVQRAAAAFLERNPGAFGAAFEMLDADLRALYVFAYQSWLWNRTLAAAIHDLPGTFEVAYAAGRHIFWERLDEDSWQRLLAMDIPFIAPAQQFDEPLTTIVEGLLAEEGITQRQLRLKPPARTFFGKGKRRAVVVPGELHSTSGDDDLNRGRLKLTLSFELPKGSYATIVLKRLLHAPLPAGTGLDADAE